MGNGPTYVRYTGAKDGETRIIRMQELPVDPIEPAKFKHMKAPAAPPSPPVPIMHSPQRKVTVEDQRMWRIPPCVSNWKNTKGYTIAADKRLAADGRGLQEVQINDNFAAFSETLYLAERNARSELAARQDMQSRIEMKKREMKEQQLRELAAEAREQRGGIDGALRHTLAESYDDANVAEEAEVEALEEREEIRHERRRELQRDLRMSHMGKNARQSKMERDANRDVSEQIALGKRAGGGGGDALFDQRLFNQSQGMSSGFGAEDSYNAYDKDLFRGNVASHVYRPSASIDEETNVQAMLDAAAASSGKFQPDRGFRGAETTVEMRASGRSKPVQFESGPMDTLLDGAVADDRIVQPQATAAPEQDPFGMDKFLTDAKRGKPLAHIGSQGFMQASGGSGPSDGYSKVHSGRVGFSEARERSRSPPRPAHAPGPPATELAPPRRRHSSPSPHRRQRSRTPDHSPARRRHDSRSPARKRSTPPRRRHRSRSPSYSPVRSRRLDSRSPARHRRSRSPVQQDSRRRHRSPSPAPDRHRRRSAERSPSPPRRHRARSPSPDSADSDDDERARRERQKRRRE